MSRITIKISKLLNFLFDFILKKIGMNLRHLFSYLLSKLYSNRVNENLLVFGSTNGKAFSGNSKYLFLYLNQHSNYHCIWMTSSEKILKDLHNKNYNVISNRDIFKTIKTLKAAKYIFITHGFADISMVDFSPKTQLIRLSHGIVLKKLGPEVKNPYQKIFKRKIRQVLDKSISFFVVSSEKDKDIQKLRYSLPSYKFIPTGYPRNDILVNYTQKKFLEIKRYLNIEDNNEVLLYAPTWRNYKFKNPLEGEFLKKLDDFLTKDNKVLLYKPHPASKKIDINHCNSVKSVDPNVDIMDLLVITDILITDYSGVFFDFLITERPIIFFAYDLEKYLMDQGLNYDYETFVPGLIVKTIDDLLLKLKSINQWAKEYEEKRKKVRNLYVKYSDGNSIRKLVDFLNLKITS